jgi:hypothetical protein
MLGDRVCLFEIHSLFLPKANILSLRFVLSVVKFFYENPLKKSNQTLVRPAVKDASSYWNYNKFIFHRLTLHQAR